MSKELEPLEALRIIKEHDFPVTIATMPPIPATMSGKTENELWDIIEQALKALEIISRKGVNTLDVMESENYDDYIKIEKQYYYDHYIEGRMPDFDDWLETWVLTKTEYELLKEVLL